MSLSAPEQGGPTPQDPAAAAPAAPAAPPAAPPAPVGDGPWAQDLALLFEDEATRGRVDTFLRSKVQPHTTKLEQQLAEQRDAVELWSQLTDEQKSAAAYADITQQLLGDAAAPVLDYLTQLQNQTPTAQGQPAEQPVDPRVAAALEYVENQQAEKYYDQEFNRILTQAPDLIDADPRAQEAKQRIYHMCVDNAGGDFDKALELYRATTSTFAPAPPAPAAPVAPPALGSDAGGANSSATPVAPKKQTLDEAINDFMAEQRAARQAPPVMG